MGIPNEEDKNNVIVTTFINPVLNNNILYSMY